MINKLKNWWFIILSIVVAIVDAGYDVINPALELLGMSDGTLNTIKALLLIGAIVRAKLETPTQNPEKLQALAEKKAAQADEGDPIPGGGPKGN